MYRMHEHVSTGMEVLQVPYYGVLFQNRQLVCRAVTVQQQNQGETRDALITGVTVNVHFCSIKLILSLKSNSMLSASLERQRERERETETDTGTDRQTERETETEIQTDRQTDRNTDRNADRQRGSVKNMSNN